MTEDILERAKALRSSAFGTHKQALDVVDELIADIERLRSLTLDQQYMMDDLDKEIASKDARIKELEADCKSNIETIELKCHQIGILESQYTRLEAAFLEAKRCPTCNGKGFIRDPYLSRVRGLIIDESIDRICPMCEGKGEENAREALERIKEGKG